MRKTSHAVKNNKVILLSSLIAALLILVSGLLWMTLCQTVEPNASLVNNSSLAQAGSSDTVTSTQPSSKPVSEQSPPDSSPSSSGSENSQASDTSSAEESREASTVSEETSSYFPVETNDVSAEKDGYIIPQPGLPKVVPFSEAADPAYLEDAVFIGDSISVSLSLYKALPAKNVIATQNVSLYGVTTGGRVFATAKGKVSLETALKGKDPKKIYILLGANGMNGFSNKKQIGYYETLLDQLEAWYPNAIIYVQSMTPVTAAKNKTDKNINNKKIRDYNQKLLALVETRGDRVYYLNLSEALETKYGNLKSKYDGGDGLHFSPSAARAVVQYALEHTVPEQ